MREVDRRTRVSRRVFIRGAATAGPALAAAAAGITINAESAWAQSATTLSPHVMATLATVARDIYPHDRLGDVYYVNAVTGYDAGAKSSADLKALLEAGVASLDSGAQDRFGVVYIEVVSENDRVALLRDMEKSKFFQKLRSDLLLTLYNQKPLWVKFGYEGASADKGGYIHRGFNDIDWLPEA
jgi:hypothetical protein